MRESLNYLTFSLIINLLLLVPVIHLLFWMKIKDSNAKRDDVTGQAATIFQSLKSGKQGTPSGAGVVSILISLGFLLWFAPSVSNPIFLALIVAILGFGSLGFIDDMVKMRWRYKLVLQLILSGAIAFLLAPTDLLMLGIVAFLIAFMSNAVNITDGVDGLVAGSTIVSFLAILTLAVYQENILVTLLSATMLGGMVAYLYFNIPPARVFMGDAGALTLGPLITICLYSLGLLQLLPFIGLVFILDALSSAIQITSKIFFKRKVFKVAPFHHLLEYRGWSEAKISARFWIVQAVACLLGLLIAIPN